MKKYKIKNKIIKLILIVVLSIISAVFSFIFFTLSTDTTDSPKINYISTGNIDYKVHLKENQFYKEEYLKSNMSYIASLIDKIPLDFNYKMSLDDKMDYSYQYNINATLYIIDKDNSTSEDNVIYKSTENLFGSETQFGNSKNIDIFKSIEIDYDKFNLIAKMFASENGVSPKSYLEVVFTIKMTGNGSVIKGVNKEASMDIKIPMYSKIIDIDESQSKINNTGQFSTQGINPTYLTIAILLLGLTLALLFLSTKVILSMVPKKSKYYITLKNIFKTYDQLIVKVKNKLLVNPNDKACFVKSFEDMVNISDRIQQPIRFYETTKGKEALFIINDIRGEYYVYVLTADEK